MIMKFKNRLLYILIATFIFGITYSFSQTEKFKVALDAGHGDHDFGATYSGHVEKNINLAIVLKVGKLLEKNPNIEVIYTRKTDVFIDLVERSNIANRADANIFISIHCNANKNSSAYGSETFVMGMTKNASNLEAAKKENDVIKMEKDYKQKYVGYNPNQPESLIGMTLMQEEYMENSISLAGKIQDNFKNAMGVKSRGVSQAPFMVLHKSYMPRVLVETGFISNKEEGDRLDSEEGQNDIAQAIAEAIVGYKKDFFGEDSNEPKIDKPIKRIVEKPIEVIKKDTIEVKQNEKVNEVIDENGLVFKVQLSASSKKINLVPKNFKGLKNITSSYYNGLYRYMYGSTNSHEEAKKLLQEAKSKGYSTSYLIAFKNGKSINIQDAIK